jgi:hypothetical protein
MHIFAESQSSQYKAFNILYFRVEWQAMIFKTEALLPALEPVELSSSENQVGYC